TAEAIAMIKELESLPVDGVMIFPPLLLAWGKVSGDLKVKFFKDICDNTNLPIVLFQVPVLSYWFDAPTVKRIAELDNVVAYKEASFNIQLYSETMRLLQKADSKMNVLTGNDRFVAESYILGAKGALIGVANLATEKWAELDRAGRTGDFRKAMALQEELMDLKELVFNEPIVEAVARIKLVLHDQGLIDSPAVRAPQMGISDEEKVKLLDSYKTLVD
ncbi:MAG: dihydrodipicolinate synthase family protein, partial [Firmicutes bacterium]|nr:dihydrodipicolinate synthase family protein [Bacillota bacterium]